MVGIDREVSDSGVEAMIQDMGNQGAVLKWNERLRERIREWLQARAEARPEKKSFSHAPILL